jgi:chromosome segregation ATPase
MSEQDNEGLTRGEDFASFERRMISLFERMAERAATSEQEAERREERIQRRIEFIIQQQAQFNADMQRLREAQERNDERWAETEERWRRAGERWENTEVSVRSLHAIAQIHEGEIMALAESHSDTKERLNALIDTVERVISERPNGGAQKKDGSE